MEEPDVRTSAAGSQDVWAYVTRRFRTLEYDFAVRSSHAGIGRFIDEMYSPSAIPGQPAVWYSIRHDLTGRTPHALYVDRECLTRSARPARVMAYLTWHVNRCVIDTGSRFVLLHAAAAARDGVAVLLPAAMEAGKTTLVAGLVRRGFQYLTDEAAAIEPDSLEIEPFPKPLSIDPGSWSVLPELRPVVESSTAAYLEEQWQVTPKVMRPDAISPRVPVDLVVFPRYDAGSATVLEPVSRSEALVSMMQQTFHFHRDGRRNLEVLGRLVGASSCWRLVASDLDEACDAIGRLADGRRGCGSRGGRTA
jgi:hypothetical protein